MWNIDTVTESMGGRIWYDITKPDGSHFGRVPDLLVAIAAIIGAKGREIMIAHGATHITIQVTGWHARPPHDERGS